MTDRTPGYEHKPTSSTQEQTFPPSTSLPGKHGENAVHHFDESLEEAAKAGMVHNVTVDGDNITLNADSLADVVEPRKTPRTEHYVPLNPEQKPKSSKVARIAGAAAGVLAVFGGGVWFANSTGNKPVSTASASANPAPTPSVETTRTLSPEEQLLADLREMSVAEFYEQPRNVQLLLVHAEQDKVRAGGSGYSIFFYKRAPGGNFLGDSNPADIARRTSLGQDITNMRTFAEQLMYAQEKPGTPNNERTDPMDKVMAKKMMAGLYYYLDSEAALFRDNYIDAQDTSFQLEQRGMPVTLSTSPLKEGKDREGKEIEYVDTIETIGGQSYRVRNVYVEDAETSRGDWLEYSREKVKISIEG